MPGRTYLNTYTRAVRLSRSAVSNLAIAQVNYAYTGIMEIDTGIVDVCGAAGTNPHYSTITPLHHQTFPQYVEGRNVAPLVHGGTGSGNTTHQLLARCVIDSPGRGVAVEEAFCGFTVRFEAKPRAEFSGTSRSLNTGTGFSNGELEVALRIPIMAQIGRVLSIYGWTSLVHVPPRVTPDDAQRQRGGPVAAAGLFASIRGRGGKP